MGPLVGPFFVPVIALEAKQTPDDTLQPGDRRVGLRPLRDDVLVFSAKVILPPLPHTDSRSNRAGFSCNSTGLAGNLVGLLKS